MKKRHWFLAALALLAVSVGVSASRAGAPPCHEACVDEARVKFAQCLTDRGFVLYGASWCHSCHEQLARFGSPAWQRIKYVDCAPSYAEALPICEAMHFKIFPTWVLADGRWIEGNVRLAILANASGCPAPP